MLLRESQADLVRIDPAPLLRDHDRARPRRLRRVGRVRRHGRCPTGCSRRSGSGCAAAGVAIAWSPGGRWSSASSGIVVTTLGMKFGASWVFLYPLPFGSGEWSDTATGPLLGVGPARRRLDHRWCLAILHTVVGPGLGAGAGHRSRRLGAALGFGYIWPKTFRTDTPAALPRHPADGDRHRHDHRDAAARGAARRDDHPVDRPVGDDRRAARQEPPVVLRPPGRLPAAVPGGLDLLPAVPRFAEARPRRRARSSRSRGSSP